MDKVLEEISQVHGVLGSFFLGGKENFYKKAELKDLSKEKLEKAIGIISQSLDAVGEQRKRRAKRIIFTTDLYRIFIQEVSGGFFSVLCSRTADVSAVISLLSRAALGVPVLPKEVPKIKPEVVPKAPEVVVQKVVPTPPPVEVEIPPRPPEKPLPDKILDDILALCEEELGDLASTIFENLVSDTKINEGTLTRERVMKFCLALQKDASLIIGPKASKKMVDKMLDML